MELNSSKSYRIALTNLQHIYTVRINYGLFTGYDIDLVTKLYDFAAINTFPVISACIDSNRKLVIQFSDFTFFAIDIITASVLNFDANLTSMIGVSVLQSNRPTNKNDG